MPESEEKVAECDARPPVVALTIAGSDSGGGAGIQADMKTFSRLGVFGTSAVTCLTAQNSTSVKATSGIVPEMVKLQIQTICEEFEIGAAKTGMLYSSEIVKGVTEALMVQGFPWLVVDPVMVSTSGAELLQKDAMDVLCSHLLPLAKLMTPNCREAEALTGRGIHSLDDMKDAARELGEKYELACVVKGGHLQGAEVSDVLWKDGEEHVFTSARCGTHQTHGTGCMFSAAVTARLAKGDPLVRAVEGAKTFVYEALQQMQKQAGYLV